MAFTIIEAAPERGNVTAFPSVNHTFRETAEDYLEHGGEGRYLGPVIEYFGDRPLSSIFPFDIRQMAELLYPTQSGATRNRQAITPARAVILHGYERGWCDLIRIRRFKQDRPKKKTPANGVWLALFTRQADRDGLDHVAAIVLFMATTAARVSEAVRLCWRDVDLTAGTALLARTKTGTNSLRYLTDDVAERLRRLKGTAGPDDRVFRYTARHAVNERMMNRYTESLVSGSLPNRVNPATHDAGVISASCMTMEPILARKDDEARIRVLRILRGDYTPEDLSRLLRSLRNRTFGNKALQDIADLTAHEDERNQGLMVDAITDTYYQIRMRVYAELELSAAKMPSFTFETCKAAIRNFPPQVLKKVTGLREQQARERLTIAKKKFLANSDGSVDVTKCDERDIRLIGQLCNNMHIDAVYSDSVILKELVAVLLKNHLLSKEEQYLLGDLRTRLGLFVISLLHRLDINLPDGRVAELHAELRSAALGARNLRVVALASGMMDNPKIQIGFTVFETTIDGEQHCANTLLDTVRLPLNPANPSEVVFPVEVRNDWLLHSMLH